MKERTLTKVETIFCDAKGFAIGWDIDTVPCQLAHICHPYEENKGTLCQTPNLWGQSRGFANACGDALTITCLECLSLLETMINNN